MTDTAIPTVWLAAEYHVPTTYSCSIPLSSKASARAMPAPGPATVRLAMLRVALECFGAERTRTILYPTICSTPIHIRPPARVAISTQRIRAYKANVDMHGAIDLVETLIYREVAHTMGTMTIYMAVPTDHVPLYQAVFQAIGYWGTADSLATCIAVTQTGPPVSECVMPLRTVPPTAALHNYFVCLVSELRAETSTWDQLMGITHPAELDIETLEVYVWPMVIRERRSNSMLLERRSIVG